MRSSLQLVKQSIESLFAFPRQKWIRHMTFLCNTFLRPICEPAIYYIIILNSHLTQRECHV